MSIHDGTQRCRTGWQPDESFVAIPYYVRLRYNLPVYRPLFVRHYHNGETEPMILHIKGHVL